MAIGNCWLSVWPHITGFRLLNCTCVTCWNSDIKWRPFALLLGGCCTVQFFKLPGMQQWSELCIYILRKECCCEPKEHPSSLNVCHNWGNTTYVHVCPDILDSREREEAVCTVALLFPPQLQVPAPHHHHPPCRGPLACQIQECVHHANAVMNLPLRPTLSSSLESWWNVNINHVGHSTSTTLKGQEGIVIFYSFPNEGHTV